MIKHQILILFLCIAVVAWAAYKVREHRRSKENQEDIDDKPDDNL